MQRKWRLKWKTGARKTIKFNINNVNGIKTAQWLALRIIKTSSIRRVLSPHRHSISAPSRRGLPFICPVLAYLKIRFEVCTVCSAYLFLVFHFRIIFVFQVKGKWEVGTKVRTRDRRRAMLVFHSLALGASKAVSYTLYLALFFFSRLPSSQPCISFLYDAFPFTRFGREKYGRKRG